MKLNKNKELLTLDEASEVLRVCKRTLQNYIKGEKIKITRLSFKKVLIPKKELESFIRKYYG